MAKPAAARNAASQADFISLEAALAGSGSAQAASQTEAGSLRRSLFTSAIASGAADESSARCIAILAAHGGDPLMTDRNGQAPIHFAAAFNRPASIQALASLGADLNLATAKGSRPLHMAASRGALLAVLALAEAGADLNATDADGLTPLGLATQNIATDKASPKRQAVYDALLSLSEQAELAQTIAAPAPSSSAKLSL